MPCSVVTRFYPPENACSAAIPGVPEQRGNRGRMLTGGRWRSGQGYHRGRRFHEQKADGIP